MDIIVSRCFGTFEACEATLANALEILSWQPITQEVSDFAKNPPGPVTTYESLAALVKNMIKAPEGTVLFSCPATGAKITATLALKQATALYLFEKKILAEDLSAYNLKTKCDLDALPWLAPAIQGTLMDQWVVDQGEKYQTILQDAWKPGIAESRKVKFVLQLVNDLCRREEEYVCISVTAKP